MSWRALTAATFLRACSLSLLTASLLAVGACSSHEPASEGAPGKARAALESDGPLVNLTTPANGATVTGLVAVAADASDPDGVEQVEFLVDGASLGIDHTEPFTGRWLASAAPAGAHELRARATDSLGNVGVSSSITVTVPASESHPGLVAAWGFDEGSGTEVHDATGAGHNATLTGQMWVSGKYGNALAFGSDHLTVAPSAWLDLSQSMTLSAWVLPDVDLEQSPVVLQKGWQPAYVLRPGSWWAAEIGFRAENFDWFAAQAPRDVEAKPGAWTHVAGTYDGSAVRLYLNGGLVAEAPATALIPAVDGALTIGGEGDPNARFPGRLDEIRIYNRALSAAEIASDMATPVTAGAVADTTPPEVDLIEPAPGATVSGLVTLTADVEDDGGVRSVRFLVDGAPLGAALTKPPYTRAWHASSSTAGSHSLQAEATDIEGNTQLSAAVNVIVPESASLPGLVLALGFDEGEGNETHDATGAGHNGSLSGQTWAAGKFGSSLEFDGHVLELTESELLDLSDTLTISAWVLPRPGTPRRSAVLMKKNWWEFSYALYAGNGEGGPGLQVLGDEWGWADVGAPMALATWSHLAATSDGDELKVYVNGQLAQANGFDGSLLRQVDGPIYVGGDAADSEVAFLGRIDELRVYNRVLSASEIAADMYKPITAGASSETTPPVVSLSAPVSGETVFGLVALAADASDANGVEQVEFLVDGASLGIDRTAPFTERWLASASVAGTHELVARATDFAGNVGVSAPITVTVPSSVSHPGLVAAWGFDEGAGAVIHDATGAGNDAALSDQTWVTGKFGSALRFGSSRIDVPHSRWLDLTHAMTLSAWVLPEVEIENAAVVLQKGWQSAYWLRPGGWWAAETGFRSNSYDWFGTNGPYGAEAKPGAWTHVAGTYDGHFVRLYLNGEAVAQTEATESIISVSEALMIGGNDDEDTLFPGRLDEIRIYDRALSAAEVTSDMATPVTAGATADTTPPEVDLVQPASGATVTGLVTLTADVEDDGGIRNVRFFVDGAPLGAALTKPPYTRTWHASSATAGSHSLQAEATDSEGNTQLSAAVTVTVPESASLPGLVLALGFDEGEGSETHDATGAGHNALLSGQTWAAGKFGSSLEFNGSVLEVTDSDLLDLTDTLTLSAWVLPRPGNPRRSVVAARKNWWEFAFALYAGNGEGGPGLQVLGDEWGWADVGPPMALSTWSHLTATSDGSELKVYVNGQLVQSNGFFGGRLRQLDGPFYVGGDATTSDGAFIGRIDELRVYNRVLSASEIAADMSKPITTGADRETTPPIVSLSAPAEDAAVSGLVVLAADVSDANGVEQVEFLVDGTSLGVDRTEPFNGRWLASAASAGTHELVARATDFAGNLGVSAPVTVTVPASEAHLGLVAAWGFDEGSGTEAHDATGAGNHATLTDQTWVAGKYGSALQFGSDHLTVAPSSWLDLSQSMTLSAWVLPDVELEASPVVLQKGWQPAYVLRPGSWWSAEAGIRAENYDWFTAQAPRDVEAKPGAWTHVAGTYDGSSVRLYLNGEQVAEAPANVLIPPVDGALTIGGNGDPNALFPGRLDEIRVYNRALSAAEIASDMATPVIAGATSDTTPPTVALTEPAGGAAAGLVTLAATASDDSGIRGVQFVLDGQPLGVPLTAPPYRRTWHANSATAGNHELRVRATDRAGNVATTDAVTLVVDQASSVPGLVLALGFDEGSGGLAHDASGAGHDAPLGGQTWAPGRFGSSLEFDGQLITIPSSDLLDLTTGMTLSAWVRRRPDTTSWSTLLMKERDNERSYFFYTGSEDRGPEICIEAPGSMCIGGETRPPASRWTHVAATYDAQELRLYVNGELEGTLADATGSLRQVGGALHVGGNLTWSEEVFRGRLDELRIYNRALSPAEIQADMTTPITAGALPDITPPTVSMTAPANGASVSGVAELEASAADDSGVKSVEFFVDGAPLGPAVLSAPFRRAWHTASAALGGHELSARATDYFGNVALSAPISVNVVPREPAAGLVAAFGFDEGEGVSTADASGRGHNTTLSGQSWVEGKYGKALEFTGSYLTIADSDYLDLTTQMTLSAWVMPTAPLVTYPTVLAKEGDVDFSFSYALYANSDGAGGPSTFFKLNDDWIDASGGEAPPVDVWTHLAATYDGEALRVYVNSELVAETATNLALPTSSAPLRIGANSYWPEEVFRGRIDEVRIYANALSAVEIEEDMARPIHPPSGPDTTPPIVALTAPSSGASVSGMVLLRAQATDAGGVASVRFFVDGQALGSPLTAPPYEATWPTAGLALGSHSLRVDATDLAGNSASSAIVSVTLTTSPGCDPATVSDGNPCTTDTCDGPSAVFTKLPAGSSCSNGNRCDGAETCNAAGSCQPGTPPTVDASCDGVDDDCDGSFDEDYAPVTTTCGVGACRATGSKTCSNGSEQDSCSPRAAVATSDVTCNGVDDDCDGPIDEDYVPAPIHCGVGACQADGVRICSIGALQDFCVPGSPSVSDTTCNGIDDDCDGQRDEDFVSQQTQCGAGACQATGVTHCDLGVLSDSCSASGGGGNDSICDGVDSDCDGAIDEAYAPHATTCGVGACARNGMSSCVGGHESLGCVAGTPTSDANCNGVDDDCDGSVDEDYVGHATTCGVGACAANGTSQCVGGVEDSACVALQPVGPDTTCNGVDDDCNGTVDDAFAVTSVSCGVGACATTGSITCDHGQLSNGCHAGTGASSDATCNGVDDDCDGSVDEDYAPPSTECGVGACHATGELRCVGGATQDTCHAAPAAADDSSCNGVDDDCNGTVDDDYQSHQTSCGSGACATHGTTACQSGHEVDSCAPSHGAALDTVCNGIDDDCDGSVDEDYAAVATTCGVGACVTTGSKTCSGGSEHDSCSPLAAAASDATCNGVDDDCDGSIDEDFVAATTSCGVGACAATGHDNCVAGHLSNDCHAGTAGASDATCNGIDDDCDGSTDEDFAGSTTTCGVGACIRTGSEQCQAGHVVNTCAAAAPAASDATCDGVDDDCDGSADEDYPATSTTCGTGACIASGELRCVGGHVSNTCHSGTSAADDHDCNGVDDDCDGAVDEDFVSTPTQCGAGACQANGSTSCVGGVVQDSCQGGTVAAEDATCDGIDNDCDGVVDDGYLPHATTCGVGACARSGTTSCIAGHESNTCQAGTPAGNDATCNGVDDDCDGSADEDYVAPATTCGIGACAATGSIRCEGGAPVVDCNAGAASSDANCNGVDDDCDGSVDDDYVATPTSCGQGACAATGSTRCEAGHVTSTCVAGNPATADASCDGIDNDCDGSVDEEYLPESVSCGVGACVRTGETRCQSGTVQPVCTPGTAAASDDGCNGVDDDCDGSVDEGYVGHATTCGQGSCSATGTTACQAGHEIDSCHAGAGSASDTVCNGLDDDCDGSKDEDYVPVSVSCGVGVCAATGTTSCQNGAVVSACTPGSPISDDSSCNGVDDDCDGSIDEAFVPLPVSCGVGACRATGVTTCQSGIETPQCAPGSPASSDATCNGVDDDCDGSTDEEFVQTPTSCGLGACAATGHTACEAGHVANTCAPGQPASDANCNGADDDCDGSVDEDYASHATSCGVGACAATGTTGCTGGNETNDCAPHAATSDANCNGTDDDCDGSVDEDYVALPTSCGQGACAASGTTACSAGQVSDSCHAKPPATSDATCDGVDDDCDGSLDEDYVPQETVCGVGACRTTGSVACENGHTSDTCTPLPKSGDDSDCDGVDDDCDGQADESFGTHCAGTAIETCASGALQTQDCLDGDACNGSESCSAGHCVAGTPVSTSDGNPCTADACGAGGVTHSPLALGADCGNGQVCDGQGTCIGKPVITTQPSSTSVSPGADANFAVSATGALLTYEWRRLGQPIPGATSPTLTLPNVQPSDSGTELTVAVSNPAGTVVSSAVTLAVTDTSGPVLTIDGEAQREIATDTAVLTGTVLDNGQPAASIVASSNRFPGEVAGIIDVGSGAFRIEVPVSPGVNALTLTAKDAAGNTTQKSILATLALSRLPRVTLTQPANGLETQADKLDVSGYVRSSLAPEKIRLVLGDAIVFPTGSGGEYSFTFKDVRLNLGPNLISVRAETPDGAVTAQAAVLRSEPGTVSDDAPVVAVIGGASLQFVKDATLPIKGTVTSKRCTTSVTVNGTNATLTGAGSSISFAATLTLPVGDAEVPVAISATDCDGRIGKLTYKVIHDDVAPVIDVALAPAPAVHNVSTTPYLIAGRITEGHLATVSSNQQSLGVLPGAPGSYDFSFAVPLTRGMDEVVTIEAVDLAGNTASHSLKLHLDAAVDIEIISPVAGGTIQTLKDPVDVDVVARIVGLPSDFSAVARLDNGGIYALTRSDSTFKATLSVRGITANHSLAVSVLNGAGTSVATQSVSFKVTDANSIPLAASLKSPLGGASNVEANEPIVIELNRPVADPKKIKIEVTETVHGKRYKPYSLGASISEFTNVQLEDINRDQAAVPGGISFLPGARLFAFYPARDYGYGAQVNVRVLHDGTELARGQINIRPLPTLMTGFIGDQFLNPIPELDVRLDDLQVTTQTNVEGVFSLGFGKAEAAIPPGRHKLVINPGLKNPSYGTIERWVNLQAGRLQDLGVISTPLLDAGEPFRRISGGRASVLLRGGDLDLDLSHASLLFPDGTTEGDVHTDVFFGPAVGYPAISVGIPLLSYALQPMGIQVNGPFDVSFALPPAGNSNYVDNLPDYVLLVGLDPEALLLVPIGVGRVDHEQHRLRSARALEARRLDFIAMAPLAGSSFQSLFSQFAEGSVDLPTLTMALEKTR